MAKVSVSAAQVATFLGFKHRGFQVVDAGSGQDVLSKGLDAVKARVSLAKTGQHVAGSPRRYGP